MDEINGDLDLIVGRRVRARRRLLGYSQQELGTACGVTFQQVHKYEAALNRLSVVMLWRLSKALDVEVGYFFTGLTEDEATIARRRGLAIAREAGAAGAVAREAGRSFAV